MSFVKYNRVANALSIQSTRTVATIPKPTTKKPTLEEFDPLNPGGWQLGAGGKILPRLPEGTRCGKLVMGKYGLYDPKLRRQVEEFSASFLFLLLFIFRSMEFILT